MEPKYFTQLYNELALEQAKNISNSVDRYSDYLTFLIKRISKRKHIFKDLFNALLQVSACFEPEKIQAILDRPSLHALERLFIKKLIDNRLLLNPYCPNQSIRSDFTRLLMLQKITEEYNEEVDKQQKANLKVNIQFYKRKVYTLIPREDLKPDNKRHFISVPPSAAVGFFWSFSHSDTNIGFVNDQG